MAVEPLWLQILAMNQAISLVLLELEKVLWEQLVELAA